MLTGFLDVHRGDIVPEGVLYCAPTRPVTHASTHIHSVLDDHSTGEYKRSNFDGSRVQDIYDVHILLLETIKEEKPDKYRVMMENIFTLASYVPAPALIYSKLSF
ncbi:hypothetical protein DFH08DRAFT_972559 [Mycena albidolilacea]|uniref:DUF6532 domain-containing protein n=1 Tax=Mycena albidolilacea TaxID=1033008 RepID=A0AAD6ZAU4_9AGAR|nr:hypothetical protein DFH08DRAFT_972559 [Mycena albidolilacea]